MCASSDVTYATDTALKDMESLGSVTRQLLASVRGRTANEQFDNTVGVAYYSKAFLPRLADAYYALFSPVTVRSVRTTYDGTYAFEDLPPGSYYVVNRYSTLATDVVWRVPVAVSTPSAQVQDLANYNLTDLRRLLALDDVQQKIDWIESMIATYYSTPAERLEFVRGEAAMSQQAGLESLPDSWPKSPLHCR